MRVAKSALVSMVVCSLIMAVGSSCFSQEENPYWYFAAKTSYADRAGNNPPIMRKEESNCTPKLFYLLARHGSRYPSAGDYNKMVKQLPDLHQQILKAASEGRGELCTADVTALRDWRQQIKPYDVDALADTGRGEMQHIARSYKNVFPSLLRQPFSKERYLFQSSYMERIIESAKGFASGLFNMEEVNLVYNPKGQDSLLQFYKACNKTQQTMGEEIKERSKFILGPEMKAMTQNVARRLGLELDQLTYDKIDAMYKMCVFDRVVELISPWCAVFSSEDLVIWEYLEDLRNYYLEGPAHQINIDQSCDLMKDMFKYLRLPAKSEDKSHPLGVFRFTHSPVINSLFAQLGLFSDQQPLRADNMEAMRNRKWKLSLIDPYSAHVAIVVEECANSQYVFRTYINQVLYTDDKGPMTLTNATMLNAAELFAKTCDFDAICSTDSVWRICHSVLLTTLCVFLSSLI